MNNVQICCLETTFKDIVEKDEDYGLRYGLRLKFKCKFQR
jgi:hypothetical protein